MPRSIKKRFQASFISNVLRSGISFATGMVLARLMGPVDYGRLLFLLASFQAIRQIMDLATTSAFFTFISRKPRSKSFFAYYGFWVLAQFIFPLLCISIIMPPSWIESIWNHEPRFLVLLAFIASFFQTVLWSNAVQMAEANRLTTLAQILNTGAVIIHLASVIGLWYLGHLMIPWLLLIIAFEYLSITVVVLLGYFKTISWHLIEEIDTPRSVFQEFFHYCLPFIPYSLLGFAHDFLDRWMLQTWGGSKEQAYFGVSSQFASIALLATSSILRIFWKEVAEAYHKKDLVEVKRLYHKTARNLYIVGAFIAGGVVPWTTEIIALLLGPNYTGATSTMMLMFLYPVHQSLGQITGTITYATGHTKLQVVYGIAFMSCGLIASYLLLAPPDAFVPGFGLKADGLAYKMVFIQLVGVNVLGMMIAKTFKWKYVWGYQLWSLAGFLAIGWLNFFSIRRLPFLNSLENSAKSTSILLASGGLSYIAICFVLFLVFNKIFYKK